MVVAYVLVTASTGEAERLKGEMRAIDGVVSVDVVAGDVDFVVKVDVDSPAAVRDVAANRIHDVEGVVDTRTYIAMD